MPQIVPRPVQAPNPPLRPVLLETLREGYTSEHLRRDTLAALTVAIVAIPLSMAIAIASGADPRMGLMTAVVGGFFISAFGGSRYQIGGPAGAFIVLVASTVVEHGISGMVLATFLAGLIMMLAGALRLGSYIKFIPYPVTVGFTAGIAVIIFASQIRSLLGLSLAGPEPGPFLEKLPLIWQALPTLSPATLAVSLATIALILGLKRIAPRLPNLLITVVAISLVVALLGIDTPTIESTYGPVPAGLPRFSLPDFSLNTALAVLPNAIGFALLGSIEALLSAVVADGMSGRHHNSNQELLGQGLANLASACLGGMIATGTIARTATNVRANAHSPVAGMLHAVFVLVFLLFAAPLIGQIPLACLAGLLATVAWNMIERPAIATLLRTSRADSVVLFVTLALTVFRDLTEAIVVGFALGSMLFIHRMSKAAEVQAVPAPYSTPTQAVPSETASIPRDDPVLVYRIRGAVFFGAAATVGSVLSSIGDTHRALVIDFSDATLVDSSALHAIESLVDSALRRGVVVALAGVSDELAAQLSAYGLSSPRLVLSPSLDDAVRDARLAAGLE